MFSRVVAVASMLVLGIVTGRNIDIVHAESTVCGSFRHQTVALSEPTIEVLEGETDVVAEEARWRAGELTPERVHELGGPEMLDDERLRFTGISGYGVGMLVLVPEGDA